MKKLIAKIIYWCYFIKINEEYKKKLVQLGLD